METMQQTPLLGATTASSQPWVYAAWLDGIFILSPPFVALLIIAFNPAMFSGANATVNTAWWLVLVILIDVAHVYATVYRTYFDTAAVKANRLLFYGMPALAYVGGVALYCCGPGVFWRVLAYLAVFHFIRQQYGFLRIYVRKDLQARWMQKIDTIAIYAATVYPLLYWHLKGPRNFDWFMKNDFYYFHHESWLKTLTIAYLIVLIVYACKEIMLFVATKQINIPKQLLVLGTISSWYFGIVYFNGDLAFTLLNVVSHGIPYMALVWAYGRKRYYAPSQRSGFLSLVFSNYGILLFIGIIALFAYVEEGFWDSWMWQEHGSLFTLFSEMQPLESNWAIILLVPLLAMPQFTHYLLDGFIWKINKDKYNWKDSTLQP
ncbi:hypothetical protein ACE38W_15200 [Chitinophaga sp. Hz27]|uniref:hypothetical protein n=1 Tax=Chitinophaga sp. Hz27 TaxID=3347169 RepID=UPI0035DD680F